MEHRRKLNHIIFFLLAIPFGFLGKFFLDQSKDGYEFFGFIASIFFILSLGFILIGVLRLIANKQILDD